MKQVCLLSRLSVLASLTVAAAALSVLSGCQTAPYQGQARDVKKRPNDGGIVAVPLDPKPEDRARAEEHMRGNCEGGLYKIVDEGEAVVGQKTSSHADEYRRDRTQHQVGSMFGMPIVSGDPGGKNVSTESSTENVKEWQISYSCEHGKKTTQIH